MNYGHTPFVAVGRAAWAATERVRSQVYRAQESVLGDATQLFQGGRRARGGLL